MKNSNANKALFNRDPILKVTGLNKVFGRSKGFFGKSTSLVQAVTDVDFEVYPGETLAIVGESGCGKSTTARLILRLIEPDSGNIIVDGMDISKNDALELKHLRKSVQMVFQDSYASLNPRLTIGQAVMFGPRTLGLSIVKAREIARETLSNVGLDPTRFEGLFPHQISGGQRQRGNIARSLAFRPKIVVMDEPLSALDKSIEAQVVNLLCDLRDQYNLTYVFISHDLNVVQYIADRVLVMYLGKVVEIGDVGSLFSNPRHPYTRALMASVPSRDPKIRTQSAPIMGDLPSPINPPSGCRFRTRCPYAEDICGAEVPLLTPQKSAGGNQVACHMEKIGSGHSKGGILDE